MRLTLPGRWMPFVALLMMALASLSAAEAAKPNIIFVLFDDLGYGEPPSYNPKSALRTPNCPMRAG